MSDSESEEDDPFAGIIRPEINTSAPLVGYEDEDDEEEEQPSAAAAAPAAAEEEEDDDEEEETGGLLGAEAAFAGSTGTDGLELDPFRIAPGMDIPAISDGGSTSAGKQKKGTGGKVDTHRVFVGNLPHSVDDSGLIEHFRRYGKVKEASVVKGRGFGFVSFVNEKGARFCLKQAGDPPKVEISGRECTVRYAEQKDDHGARQHKMPARGSVAHLGLDVKRQEEREEREAQRLAEREARIAGGEGEIGQMGVRMMAEAHKRSMDDRSARGFRGSGGAGSSSGGSEAKRPKPSGEEKGIVTVSKRQDAEPLHKAPITMREIFPKEFWRI